LQRVCVPGAAPYLHRIMKHRNSRLALLFAVLARTVVFRGLSLLVSGRLMRSSRGKGVGRVNSVHFDYSGARVLVTGGTSGIGLGIASAYRDAGAEVTITGTRDAAAEYSEDLSRFTYRQLDVESREAVDALAASIDALDVLVPSAGIGFVGIGLDEYEPDIFERAVAMHLTSVYRLSKGCLGALSRSQMPGRASIIAIASVSSYLAYEVLPGYGAAKAGLVQLMKTMALSWAKHNVRANAIAPGLTITRQISAALERQRDLRDKTIARTPVGRLGVPEDIAGIALFLGSKAASFITGQTLLVDGGYSIVGE
jgi:3-oxoacyl-[acyl-carrier protein] reductase